MARLSPLARRLPVHDAPFRRAYRIISSRFPPVGVFDDLVDADELEALYALESRTNERLADDLGALELVDRDDWITGPGTTPIMAAFTHPPPDGSRFSDGSFGVYYCADAEDVAIRETAHHRQRFLRYTREPACRVEMRLYVGELIKPLHDGCAERLPDAVLDPDDYGASQALAIELRGLKSYGLLYPSVRAPGGTCAALFRPPAIRPVRQSRHYAYVYDGHAITDVVELGGHRRLA
ncbi:MAG: RES family NAD+ phosphorylase [Nevskiales bacterium]|nr:RES family NAD+ phosphorylase [Nevskiales bacterium]